MLRNSLMKLPRVVVRPVRTSIIDSYKSYPAVIFKRMWLAPGRPDERVCLDVRAAHPVRLAMPVRAPRPCRYAYGFFLATQLSSLRTGGT
jgi:hypothetical protein